MLHCVTSSGGIARLISRDRQEWGNMYVYVFLHVCDLKILGWETSSAATESQAQVKAHTRWAVDIGGGGGVTRPCIAFFSGPKVSASAALIQPSCCIY